MFNRSFYHFFYAFVLILGLAYAVLIVAGLQKEASNPVDNVAQPQ